MLRLLTLVSKAPGISPGQRFRLEQWAPHLAHDHGIELDFVPFESARLTEVLYAPGRFAEKAALVSFDFVRRLTAVLDSRRYDGVVLYREAALIGPPIYERLLARLGVPMILDFDDAIWLDPGGGRNGVFTKLRFFEKTKELCALASAVTVGNAYLAGWARQFNGNVHVVRTSIELSRYAAVPPTSGADHFRVGWTGSLSTMSLHLERARPFLERLASDIPLEVQVICSEPPRPFSGAKNTFIPWRADTEADDLAACDVGIMPLPDDAFARGKCGCKALQYMAVERPVVVSPVGMNVELVEDGVNGLLADTDDDWVRALTRLAHDRDLRRRLAIRGRRTVEEGFSSIAAASDFARAVRSAIPHGAR